MTRALLLLALLSTVARAPGPEALTLPGYRVHLHVSEELEPDLLRALARPRTVLWVTTRSNALKASLLERLPLFGESYVQFHPPILESHGAQLQRVPRTGVWLRAEELAAPTLFRLGIRPLAAELSGALTEPLRAGLRASRPSRIHWSPRTVPSLAEWGDFAGLPGSKVVEGALLGPNLARCDAGLPAGIARIQVGTEIRDVSAIPSQIPGCGLGLLAEVSPDVSDAGLSALALRVPLLELRVEVGASAERARAAVELLQRLERAAGSGHTFLTVDRLNGYLLAPDGAGP